MIDPHREAADVFFLPEMRAFRAPDLIFAALQSIQRNAGLAQLFFGPIVHHAHM
jgi:hypothetical protein